MLIAIAFTILFKRKNVLKNLVTTLIRQCALKVLIVNINRRRLIRKHFCTIKISINNIHSILKYLRVPLVTFTEEEIKTGHRLLIKNKTQPQSPELNINNDGLPVRTISSDQHFITP